MDSNGLEWNVIEYKLPAPDDVVQKLTRVSNPLADLASFAPEQIVGSLRAQWRFDKLPHLARLANAILELPLSCLSAYDEHYWLTFNGSGFPLSISGTNIVPSSLFDTFPISSVDGLQEFLRDFGGMADGALPPGGCFWRPSECVFVSADDKKYHWGMVGTWAGSLAIYHGAGGDQIVIHPDGYIGKWSHEIGLARTHDEPPIARLKFSFAELIDHFREYLALSIHSPRSPIRQSSPFF
jgi:hypothetical protein